jgi:hypothetical protein
VQLLIRPDGGIHCVYGEAIDLSRLGSLQIRRASHVEPTSDGRWTVDLSPVNGPRLGPFPLRSAALAAELQWLNAHLGRVRSDRLFELSTP